MPLKPKRRKLQGDLEQILGSPDDPLSGKKLANALSEFSKGILPPTIGIFTGKAPAQNAYDKAPALDKTKGIEDAINEFAKFNASGMSPFLFKGTAPPPIKNLQLLFDAVRKAEGTVIDIARALSYAILANYVLGRSNFTPLNITVPTWDPGILPAAITNSDDYPDNAARRKKLQRAQEASRF